MSLQLHADDVFHIFHRADLDFGRANDVEARAICGSWVSPNRNVPDRSSDCPACVNAGQDGA